MNPDPDLTVILLGKAGVGKSASGNTILGRTAFESRLSFRPVTAEIIEERGEVFGKQISVVDTPGILDTESTEKKIKQFCQQLLQSSRRCLFLVVIRVGRFTEEDQKAVRAAKRVLGDQGMKDSYLLFTGGDVLKDKTLEEVIFEDDKGPLPDVVQMFAGAYHLFNNKGDDKDQVRKLLLKSGRPHPPADASRNRRIVLLGRPGGGKSSSGNTILGSDLFKSAGGFNSVSTETVSGSATMEGRQVTVVDTPGFTDEVLSPEQLYLEIMKSIVEASPGPHAFVIVVRLGRITKAHIKLFELLPKLFDRDALQYSMVLFTHGDQLGSRSIDEEIQSNKNVSDLVSMCGGRFCVFNNKASRRGEQVENLLHQIDQMVTANGGQHYTDDMFRMAETFFKEERNLSGETAGETLQYTVWERMTPYIIGGVAGAAGTVLVGSAAVAGVGAVVGGGSVAGVGAVVGRVAVAAVSAVVGRAGVGSVVGVGAVAAAGAVVGRAAVVGLDEVVLGGAVVLRAAVTAKFLAIKSAF